MNKSDFPRPGLSQDQWERLTAIPDPAGHVEEPPAAPAPSAARNPDGALCQRDRQRLVLAEEAADYAVSLGLFAKREADEHFSDSVHRVLLSSPAEASL